MPIDLRLLRHAVALGKYGSFSRAARTLGLTQPALSKSIRALEEAVGCTLFDRDARDLCPTAAGRALLIEAEQLLQLFDDLPHDLGALGDTRSGRIVIGLGLFAADPRIVGAIGEAFTGGNGLEIEIVVGSWSVVESLLRSREIDLYVGECKNEADPSLAVEHLWSTPSAWFCRAGHPLTDSGGDPQRDLFAYPIAVPSVSPRFAAWLVRKRARAGKRAGLLISHNLDFLRRVVALGDCVGGADARVRERWSGEAPVTMLDATSPVASIQIGVVTLEGRPLTPAAMRLRDRLASLREPGAADPGADGGRAPTSTAGADSAIPFDRFLTPRLEWSPVLRMPTRRIDSRAFEYVATLAAQGSIAKASRALELTQSGLSKAIASLEARIGTPLFFRSASGMTPTPAGRELLRRLGPLVEQIDALPSKLGELGATDSVRIAAGFGCFATDTERARAVANLLQARPEVEIQAVFGHWGAMEPALRAEELDFWVGFPLWAERDREFRVIRLPESRYAWFVRPSHRFAALDEIGMEDVVEAAIAMPHVTQPAETWMQRARGGRRNLLVCNDTGLLARLAATSDVAVLSDRSSFADEVNDGRLVVRAMRDSLPSITGIVTLRRRELPQAALQLIDDLQRAAASRSAAQS